MVDAIPSSDASSLLDEFEEDARHLSEMARLNVELARVAHARSLAASEAGDIDQAEKSAAGFTRHANGVQRALALKAKLRDQRARYRREAEERAAKRQEAKTIRCRSVVAEIARMLSLTWLDQATRDRVTDEAWTRLTEDARIVADLDDPSIPDEVLARRLYRDLRPGTPRQAEVPMAETGGANTATDQPPLGPGP